MTFFRCKPCLDSLGKGLNAELGILVEMLLYWVALLSVRLVEL